MSRRSDSLGRAFTDRSVALLLAFFVGFWAFLEWNLFPGVLYAPLYPFWLPSYLGVAFASGLRNVYLPALGNGLLFDAAVLAFLYLEALLLAGLFRVVRRIYRTYRRGLAVEETR
jgi:hypothetical protein